MNKVRRNKERRKNHIIKIEEILETEEITRVEMHIKEQLTKLSRRMLTEIKISIFKIVSLKALLIQIMDKRTMKISRKSPKKRRDQIVASKKQMLLERNQNMIRIQTSLTA